MMRTHHPVFDAIIERCRKREPVPAAVVWPLSEVALRGAEEAARAGIIEPRLIGPPDGIQGLAQRLALDIGGCKIENAADCVEAANTGVTLCRKGSCQVLMKGSLHSDQFMKPVMSPETGLRDSRRISHVFILDLPSYPRTLLVTDGAININPDLDQKAEIVQNAIDLAHTLNVNAPNVAVLSAVETVNSKIPSTVDAAALCKMAERGQITGGVLDGPLAFDDATNLDAAAIKQIRSTVAGRADVLVVPDLSSGNMLVKSLEEFAGSESAGIVVGARVPIVLTSRADSPKARLASAAVAGLLAQTAVKRSYLTLLKTPITIP